MDPTRVWLTSAGKARCGSTREREPMAQEPAAHGALSSLCIQAPLQDWGEETEEDGAVYSVSLRRQRSQRLSPGEGPGDRQVRRELEGWGGRLESR